MHLAKAQFNHLDFIGAGHDNNISVETSSDDIGEGGASTIDGFAIQNNDQLKDASRFLAQASFGADYATIQMTAAMGYEAWLTEQFQLPQISMVDEMKRMALVNYYADEEEDEEEEEEEEEEFFVGSNHFDLAWVNNHLTSPDVLRQRMAFALSQIVVVNRTGDLFEDFGLFGGHYYDLMMTNSFGQYRTLLSDITLNTHMGIFLSHYNNRKSNPELNIRPDENYAREIMQLFSIGLWELNPNGTRKYDDQGQFIPTYNNEDIKEFAQVFTGLSHPFVNGFELEDPIDFFTNNIAVLPMKMYEDYHDTSSKELLNGVVLSAGQSGMEDINQTLDHLSTHANTAPFICKQLIQRFTTSNPSPQYVQDVASVFDPSSPNNFKEVLRAILLHPQARNCNPTESYTFGKLREPMVRVMNMLKSFQLEPNRENAFFYELYCLKETVGQFPLSAPSVFNFYRPDYSPQGPINQNYYVAPEFQILNSTNVIGIINDVQNRTIFGPFSGAYCEEEGYDFDPDEEIDYGESEEGWVDEWQDFSDVEPLIDNSEELINYLDIILANGLLQEDTKGIIRNAVDQLETPEERIRMALYLIFISPDYAILK
jgi:uncharacterized protein (DUF1800 family)